MLLVVDGEETGDAFEVIEDRRAREESGALIASGLTRAEAMARLAGRYDVMLAEDLG
jgi:hypothetical protein